MPGDMPPGTIAVMCQHCGTRLFAAAGSAGRQAKCAKCGAMTEVPAITIVRVVAPKVHSPAAPAVAPAASPPRPAGIPVARPVPAAPVGKSIAPAAKTARTPVAKAAAPAKAKPAHAKHSAHPEGKHAPRTAASQTPAPASPSMASMMRTQATKISQDTLAKFGKLAPASNGSPRSAADSWAAPEGSVRVWGQLRSAGPSPEETRAEAEKAAQSKSLVGRTVAAMNRVPRRILLAGSIAAAVLLVGAVGYLAYAALSGPPAGAGGLDADWTPLDYTTRATAKGQEPSGNNGDTIVRLRVKFDVRFSNLYGVTGDDWEVRDEVTPGRTFYNVSFSLTDPPNRIGTLGFIVSGAWRPKDLSIRAKHEDTWVPLAVARSKD